MNLSSTPAQGVPAGGIGKASDTPSVAAVGSMKGVLELLQELTQDTSLPRNLRRGIQGALEALNKETVAVDVRVASAVGILDDLANDSNLPVHGRTSLWSVISRLESLP